MAKLEIDFSTLNRNVLKTFPIHDKPRTYEYSKSMGAGCAGDPPGYPTYFLRDVYTQYGNSPSRGAITVIDAGDGIMRVVRSVSETGRWDVDQEKFEARMRRLWKPLPIDHPRTLAWIRARYRHSKHCYIDDSKAPNDRKRLVIYPVPYYELRTFHDDPRFSDDWRASEKAAIEQANAAIEAAAAKIAIPENHAAVRAIREFFPDHQPDMALIADPGDDLIQTWWETLAERPTPENCPGEPRWSPPRSHPYNWTWCQVCGYRVEKGAA